MILYLHKTFKLIVLHHSTQVGTPNDGDDDDDDDAGGGDDDDGFLVVMMMVVVINDDCKYGTPSGLDGTSAAIRTLLRAGAKLVLT